MHSLPEVWILEQLVELCSLLSFVQSKMVLQKDVGWTAGPCSVQYELVDSLL